MERIDWIPKYRDMRKCGDYLAQQFETFALEVRRDRT
jgi:hypothetical protein